MPLSYRESQFLYFDGERFQLRGSYLKKSEWTKNRGIFQLETKANDIFLDTDNFFIDVSIKQTKSLLKNVKYPDGVIKQTDIIRIPFQFIQNISITERKPEYNVQNIFSRFEPIRLWQSNSALQISLELYYVAIDPKIYNEEWVERMVALYKALVLPFYTGNYNYYPPPRVYLKLGDLVNNIPCIVSDVSREIPIGQFYNVYDRFCGGLYYSKKHFLPKYQKLDVTFISSYSLKWEEEIDFEKVVNLEEGVKRRG